MATVNFNEEFRSPLVRDAQALIARVVDGIAEARTQRRHSRDVVNRSRERVVWSDTLIGQSKAARDRLHDSITALATWERIQGAPPEKVVVLLKALMTDAERFRLEIADARLLMDDIVRWGIEAYYGA